MVYNKFFNNGNFVIVSETCQLDSTEEQHYELLSYLKMIVHAVSLEIGKD